MVSTDPVAAKPATAQEVSTDSSLLNPAIPEVVSTDPGPPAPGRAPSASACEPYRELIVDALGLGWNAMAIWQDLVDQHGFTARDARCPPGSWLELGKRRRLKPLPCSFPG
jgi:hypothetical protein